MKHLCYIIPTLLTDLNNILIHLKQPNKSTITLHNHLLTHHPLAFIHTLKQTKDSMPNLIGLDQTPYLNSLNETKLKNAISKYKDIFPNDHKHIENKIQERITNIFNKQNEYLIKNQNHEEYHKQFPLYIEPKTAKEHLDYFKHNNQSGLLYIDTLKSICENDKIFNTIKRTYLDAINYGE